MRLTVRGQIEQTLLSVRPVYIVIRYADGDTLEARFTPSLGGEGMLIGGLPPKLYAAVAAYLRGAQMPRVESILVTGPGTTSYAPTFSLTWIARPRVRLT
jgi:hypothetical protein